MKLKVERWVWSLRLIDVPSLPSPLQHVGGNGCRPPKAPAPAWLRWQDRRPGPVHSGAVNLAVNMPPSGSKSSLFLDEATIGERQPVT